MKKGVIGLDIGTSSIKIIILNLNKEIIYSDVEEFSENEFNRTSINPEMVWEKTKSILERAVKSNKNVEIKSVCPTCFFPSLLILDKNSNPLTDISTWADSTAKDVVKEIDIHERTGCVSHESYSPWKILWLKNNKKEVFSKADKFISLQEYITYKLTGKFIVSDSLGSTSGLYNIHKKEWDKKTLVKEGTTFIVFNTNGMLQDRIMKFLENVKDVKCKFMFIISLDGLKKVHDEIRGVKGTFKTATKTAELVKKQGYDEVYFNTVIHKGNIDKLRELSDYIDTKTNIIQIFELIRGVSQSGLPNEFKTDTDPKEKELLFSKKDLNHVYRTMLRIYKDKLKREKVNSLTLAAQLTLIDYKLKTIKKNSRVAKCVAGNNIFVLYPEGELSYCEMMNPIGNIRKNTTKEILASDESKKQKNIIKNCFCNHGCFIDYEANPMYPFHVMKNLKRILF